MRCGIIILAFLAAALLLPQQGLAQGPTSRQMQFSWQYQLDQLAGDTVRTQEEKLQGYTNIALRLCWVGMADPAASTDCLPALARLRELLPDDKQYQDFEFIGLYYRAMDPGSLKDGWPALMKAIAKHPQEKIVVSMVNQLVMLQSTGKIDDQRRADLLKATTTVLKAQAAGPQKEMLFYACLQLSSGMKLSAEDSAELLALLQSYAATMPMLPPHLAGIIRTLRGMQNPIRCYLLSLLLIMAPVLLYAAIIKVGFKKDNPAGGFITPSRGRKLMWFFVIILGPLGIFAMEYFHPVDVFKAHILGYPLDLLDQSSNELFYAVVLVPGLLLQLLSTQLTTAAAVRLDELGPASRWIPREASTVSVIAIIMTTIPIAALTIIFFGMEFLLSGFSAGIGLTLPASLLLMRKMVHRTATGGLAHPRLREYILGIFRRFEVDVEEIYEARYAPAMMEVGILSAWPGRARSYVDPRQLKRFTPNEFYALLVHQIGHVKLKHNRKILVWMVGASVVILGLTALGSWVEYLPFISSGIFLGLTSSIGMSILARWLMNVDFEADDFVVQQTGLYQDYLNAVLKTYGLDPTTTDLSNVDNLQVKPPEKRRIKNILRWSKVINLPPPQNPDGEPVFKQ